MAESTDSHTYVDDNCFKTEGQSLWIAFSKGDCPSRVDFIEGTVPPGRVLSGGTVPLGCVLSGSIVPPGYVLSGRTVPPFNLSL